MLADHACSLGVTLVEIPASNPTYTLSSTVTRFPPQALKDALLSQVQQMIPPNQNPAPPERLPSHLSL